MLNVPQNDAFKETSDFIFGEVVGKFAHFVQKIYVFVEDKREVRLEDAVNEKIDVRFFEDM